MSVAVYRDEIFLKHEIGPGHPESPDRLRAIHRMLSGYAMRERLSFPTARDASVEEIGRVHTEAYIDRVAESREREYVRFDLDTAANRFSYAAARRAAGAVLSAVEAVVRGDFEFAFALVRPPGHHAERDRAMGFCLFNSVAIAAEHARASLGLPRIAIFDWDVHHGNGTQHAFYDRADVLYASIHQWPHYPGTGSVDEIGSQAGRGYTINMPLGAGSGDADYLYLMERVLRPVLVQFEPDLIIVSAGFDTHAADPLSGMRMSTAGYRVMTSLLRGVAREIGGVPLVLALEGGYDADALAGGVAAVLDVLCGEAPDFPAGQREGTPRDSVRKLRRRIGMLLGEVWRLPESE